MSVPLITGYDLSKESDAIFYQGLRKGVVWPDSPEGSAKLAAMWLKDQIGMKPGTLVNTELTTKSHHGHFGFWHGMATPGLDAKETQLAIVIWIEEQYKKALAADNPYERGFEIGKALHTLADTYAPSHTVREWREGIPMEIKRFQDYELQDPKMHAKGDSIFKNPVAAGMATLKSAELLEALRRKVPVEVIRPYLLGRTFSPLRISEDCESGGTHPDYAKKTPTAPTPKPFPYMGGDSYRNFGVP